jgi:periplasmic protein TonB
VPLPSLKQGPHAPQARQRHWLRPTATVAKAELAEPEAAPLTEAQSTAESPIAPLATATNTELQAAISSAPVTAVTTEADTQADTEAEASNSTPRYTPAALGAASTEAVQGELLSWLYGELTRSLAYPAIARRRGLEGRVELSLAINADGSLQLAQLRSSSGHRILDAAALDFLRELFPSPLAPGSEIQLPVNVEWRLED